jgi:hypothetical protein
MSRERWEGVIYCLASLTATVHQALRYFFVGAIATFLPLLLIEPPVAPWPVRAKGVLQTLESTSAIGFMVVAGSLVYGLHRVLVYPLLSRLWQLSVFGADARTGCCWWWPYGTTTCAELRLETKMSKAEERTYGRFVGWASEFHLYYVSIEVGLFTLLCPGWPVGLFAKVVGAGILASLGLLVWAWERQAVLMEENIRTTA